MTLQELLVAMRTKANSLLCEDEPHETIAAELNALDDSGHGDFETGTEVNSEIDDDGFLIVTITTKSTIMIPPPDDGEIDF